MKKIFLLSVIALSTIILGSCSKDDEPKAKNKTVFTISATGLNPEVDHVTIVIGGTGENEGQIIEWKKNGVLQANETAVAITHTDLAKGQVVLESATPTKHVIANLGATNMGEPYTLKFKAEVNGVVKNDITETISETYVKTFNY